ncbi:MAG: IclR family transcriptional regulator [Candidatus Acetothermia bacterium]
MSSLSTLKRGLDLLLLFDEHHPSLSVEEIAERLDTPTSTAYRYLKTLKQQGLIVKDGNSKHYKLGTRVIELAHVARQRMEVLDVAHPVMKDLADKTDETVFLAVPRDEKATCIERIEGGHNLRFSFERGRSQYLHAGASAKAIMAFYPKAKRRKIIEQVGLPQITKNTPTREDQLETQLVEIREKGYALSTGEVDPGVRAVAGPIFSWEGEVIGSISLAGPVSRLKNRQKEKAIELIVSASEEISERVSKYGFEEA